MRFRLTSNPQELLIKSYGLPNMQFSIDQATLLTDMMDQGMGMFKRALEDPDHLFDSGSQYLLN
jgi:hypothetical protein